MSGGGRGCCASGGLFPAEIRADVVWGDGDVDGAGSAADCRMQLDEDASPERGESCSVSHRISGTLMAPTPSASDTRAVSTHPGTRFRMAFRMNIGGVGQASPGLA